MAATSLAGTDTFASEAHTALEHGHGLSWFGALLGPLLSSSVLLGFSLFAQIALGLAFAWQALGFLWASALCVYGADSLLDHVRTSRRVPWPSTFWLVFGFSGMVLTAPSLRFQTWCVVALYLPFGLLWTVRVCPVWNRVQRRMEWCAPRDLSLKPWLLGSLFAIGCIGVPWGQSAENAAFPPSAATWLAAPAYTSLVVSFVVSACTSNAITMDAADLFATRSALSAKGVVDLGLKRLKRQWLYATTLQFVLGLLLALGSNQALVAAPAVFVATYTVLATRAVFELPNKWWRAIACDGQGIAIVMGLGLAWIPPLISPVAAPFAETPLSTPAAWPLWLLSSVMLGAVAWLVAYGLMLNAGRKSGTYAVPALALLSNLGWEFNHAFIHTEAFPSNLVNVAWFILDVGLMAQLVARVPSSLARYRLPRAWAGGLLALGFLLIYAFQVGFDVEFSNLTGEYSACIGNTLMSGLFLYWGISASDTSAQRVSIAIAKGVGSALYVAPIYYLTHSPLLLIQGVLTLLLDVAYFLVLNHRQQSRAPRHGSYCFEPQPNFIIDDRRC